MASEAESRDDAETEVTNKFIFRILCDEDKHFDKFKDAFSEHVTICRTHRFDVPVHTLNSYRCECSQTTQDHITNIISPIVSTLPVWISHAILSGVQPTLHKNIFKFETSGCSLGCLVDPFTFNQHGPTWQPLQRSRMHMEFNFNIEKVRITFPGKPTQGFFKIESLFNHIKRAVVVDRTGLRCILYIHLDHIPLLWRKPPQNEPSWNRTTQLPSSTSDIIGRCSTLRVALKYTDEIRILLDKLHTCNFAIWWASIGTETAKSSRVVSRLQHDNEPWAMKCLLSSGFKVLDQVTESDLDMMRQHTDVLYRVLQGPLKTEPIVNFKNYFQEALADERFIFQMGSMENSSSYCLVPKIMVTPTKINFLPPEYVKTNRVVRKYKPENFIRICFREEYETKMATMSPVSLHEVIERIKCILHEGIRVDGRLYRFLGCSNSQMRSHGAWMYGTDGHPDNTVEKIRQWMGNLETIRCVAVYVSRMGQFFSSSAPTLNLADEKYTTRTIEDVTRNGYCFTDGVGTISQNTAKEVAAQLKMKVVPSAFQIRLEGCKGVLSIDTALQNHEVCLRPSMKKFESSHQHLEVMDNSRPHQLSLNRQVITILTNLGIEDDVFLQLYEDAVMSALKMFEDNDKACSELDRMDVGIDFVKLLKSGIDIVSDSFFRSLLLTRYSYYLYHLLHKTKILIPTNQGRLLMGIADVTHTLQYGQIFVQYSHTLKQYDTNCTIHTGDVIVAKNPCFHPGDIRKLKAVDIPELRHLKNCIVFPVNGNRPHANEMSGSDLDGDMYWVCWKPELIPTQDNQLPMEFPKQEQTTLDRPPNQADIVEYYGDFIKNDQLGTIANAHLVHSDAEEDGIFSEKCLDLARIHSEAVDFSKSGTFPHVDPNLRPQVYPDFMMKHDQKQYTSEKIIGLLHRISMHLNNSINMYLESIQVTDRPVMANAQLEKLFEQNSLDQSCIESARNSYKAYSHELQFLVDKYGFDDECHLLSTNLHTVKTKNVLPGDINEVSIIIKAELSVLRKQFQQIFESECNNHGSFNVAHAWYKVAYETRNTKFRSFAWVGCNVIANATPKHHTSGADQSYKFDTLHNDDSNNDNILLSLPKVLTDILQNNDLTSVCITESKMSAHVYVPLPNKDLLSTVVGQLSQFMDANKTSYSLYILGDKIQFTVRLTHKVVNVCIFYNSDMETLVTAYQETRKEHLAVWFNEFRDFLKQNGSTSSSQNITTLHIFHMAFHLADSEDYWINPNTVMRCAAYYSKITNLIHLQEVNEFWVMPKLTIRKLHLLIMECHQLLTISATTTILSERCANEVDILRTTHTLSSDASVMLRFDVTLIEQILSARTQSSVKINQIPHKQSYLYAIEGIGNRSGLKELEKQIANFEDVAGEVRDATRSFARNSLTMIFEGVHNDDDQLRLSCKFRDAKKYVVHPYLAGECAERKDGIDMSQFKQWEESIIMLSDKHDLELVGDLRIIVRFSKFSCVIHRSIDDLEMTVGDFKRTLGRGQSWNWKHTGTHTERLNVLPLKDQMVPTHTSYAKLRTFLDQSGLLQCGVEYLTICHLVLEGTICDADSKKHPSVEVLFDKHLNVKSIRKRAIRWGALSVIRHANISDDETIGKTDISVQLQSMRYMNNKSAEIYKNLADPHSPILTQKMGYNCDDYHTFTEAANVSMPNLAVSRRFMDQVSFIRQKIIYTFKYPQPAVDHFSAHIKVDVSKVNEYHMDRSGETHLKQFYDINVVLPCVPPLQYRREIMNITRQIMELSMQISDRMTDD